MVIIDRREDEFWPQKEINLISYIPKIFNGHQHKKILPEFLNEDLAFILGTLVAEGFVSKNKIEFCNSDFQFIREFEERWQRLFPDSKLHKFNEKANSYGKKDYIRLECHSLHSLEFLRNIGLDAVKADKKLIPYLIMQSPKNVVSAFLRAYFEGDGSISFSKKMIELSCCSKSEKLIKQLQIILLRFGIDSFRRYDKYKFIDKLYLRGKRNILRFYKGINFVCENKIKKLEIVLLNYKKEYSNTDFVPFISDFVRDKSHDEFIMKHNFDRYDSMSKNYQKVSEIFSQKTGEDLSSIFEYLLTYNYLFEPVVLIENSGMQKVYSLKVESDCHTFISNGFISHNTEAKMENISEELLQDIEKKTVKMLPNFDNTLEEPDVMPGKLPNLLLNGASGIAVGMATNLPPHNINDVCDTIIEYIENPEIDIEKLIKTIQAPDFPTGGYVSGEIKELYLNGRGKLVVRGKTKIEENKGRESIIVTEIPYMVNKSTLVEEIANLVREKKLPDVSDIRDESAKGKIRIVIELRKEADSKFTLNRLFKFTRLQDRFDGMMLALVNGQPKTLNIKQIVECYVNHRRKIIRKATEFDLKKAEDRLHIVLGLLIAQKNIDEVITLIKKAHSVQEASEGLQKKFSLSVKQAQAILETKLQQLTSLELEKLKKEEKDLEEFIKELKGILGDEKEILKIIRKQLLELKRVYGDERRTIIQGNVKTLEEKDLVAKQDVVISITDKGYVKRMDVKAYKEQKRGGKGVIGSDLSTGDFVKQLLTCLTHDYLLFFTSKGKVYWSKAYEVPAAERYSKGKAIVNMLSLKDESVQSVIAVKEFKDYILFATKNGIVKKLALEELSNPRASGVKAIGLPEDNSDTLINVLPIKEKQEALLVTKDGMAVRFSSDDVRSIGRAGYGVTGIRMDKGDEVVSMEVLPLEKTKDTILTITEKGYGKRSEIEDYRLINRGGKGVINLKVTDKTGGVKKTVSADDEDSIIVTTAKGMVIRTKVKDIRVMSRATQGVHIVRLHDGDKVVDLVKVPEKEEEEEKK